MRGEYTWLIAKLLDAFGTRACVADSLGITVQTLRSRLRGARPVQREHVLAAEAVLDRLHRPTLFPPGMRGGVELPVNARTRRWTPEEDAQLADLFARHSTHDCAAMLGRTFYAVQLRAHRLGLQKSPEYVAELHQRGAQNLERYRRQQEARQ